MNKLVIALIKCYQHIPGNVHNHCKFYPTCSNYSLGVYKKFNFFKATYLTLKRLLKCHPFRKYSVDLVPQKKAR